MAPVIEIKNLSYSYGESGDVLKDINLSINRGEIFGIIGPTGAGKSTLIQHLNGLLHGNGDVIIDGMEVNKTNDRDIKTKVGLVFQNPDDQLFCPTVADDVAFGLYNMGLEEADVQRRVDEILDELYLSPLKHLSSHHLSFGEKKRVALATTLVMKPLILALDEPFANLDYNNIINIVGLIRKMDLTRIIISQDILLAFAICQRIAVMNQGRILRFGSPEQISADPAFLAGIGLDYREYMDLIKGILK